MKELTPISKNLHSNLKWKKLSCVTNKWTLFDIQQN